MTANFVIDASMTGSWLFPDEATETTRRVLRLAQDGRLLAPSIWPYEVASIVQVGVRRGRVGGQQVDAFFSMMRGLEVVIERSEPSLIFLHLGRFADRHGLSIYDAAYLELAHRDGLPLATLDDKLMRAAEAIGVPLLQP